MKDNKSTGAQPPMISDKSNQIIQCRGNTWRFQLGRHQSGGHHFSLSKPQNHDPRNFFHLHWNLRPFFSQLAGYIHPLSQSFPPKHTANLPIAFLCCEINQTQGSLFASKILDADPNDQTPAEIACDWIEESGTQAITNPNIPNGNRFPQSWDKIIANPKAKYGDQIAQYTGPLHLWCRELLQNYCTHCGIRKDYPTIHKCQSHLPTSFFEIPKPIQC